MDINYVEINNMPSVQKRDIGYRTVIDSGDINSNQGEVIVDILDLFNKSNLIEKSISEIKDVYDIENFHLQLKITELENNLAKAAQKYLEITGAEANKTILVYPEDTTTDGGIFGAFIDAKNHDITMKTSVSNSKLTLYDEVNDVTYVPPSLDVKLDITNVLPADVIGVVDNNTSNAFNKNNSSYWIRKVETKPTVSEVICEMIITLPENIITTRDINTIIMNTYPVNGLDIMEIQYKSEGSWMDIDSFKAHANSVLEDYTDIYETVYQRPVMIDAPNLKLNFRDISANQIRIVFRQRHNVLLANGNNLFYIGLKDIQILNNKYSNEYSTFEAMVDITGETGQVVFQDLEVKLNNANEISNNLIQYEFYDIYPDGSQEKKVGAEFTIINKKMLIKFKMFKNETTPNIKYIKCIYKTI